MSYEIIVSVAFLFEQMTRESFKVCVSQRIYRGVSWRRPGQGGYHGHVPHAQGQGQGLHRRNVPHVRCRRKWNCLL